MDKNFWPQLILPIVSMLTSVAGANVPGFDWLMYLGGFILALSAFIVLWNFFIKNIFLKNFYNRRDNNILNISDSEHWEFVKRLHILEDLLKELNGIDWKNKRPCGIYSMENVFASITQQLINMRSPQRIISTNLILVEIVKIFDSWLCSCDQMLKLGEVQYENEKNKNKLIKLINRYENEILAYREFCTILNNKLHSVKLINIYIQEHCFDWSLSLKSVSGSSKKI